MKVVHGTWIPATTTDFAQTGAFYIWVESDISAQRMTKGRSATHPGHLEAKDLETFLIDALGVSQAHAGQIRSSLVTMHFTLPTHQDLPVPSPEMLRYLGEDTPDEYFYRQWQTCCYRVPHVIKFLTDTHFISLQNPGEIQFGNDLLFWYHYTQAFKQTILKDHYIPALTYRAVEPLPQAGKKRKTVMAQAEFWPGWEIVSDKYEADIRRFVDHMPLACVAGSDTLRSDAPFYERETLLRHFSECLLHDIVTHTPVTAKIDDQLSGSFVVRCVHPTPTRPASTYPTRYSVIGRSDPIPPITIQEYTQWVAWRDQVTRAHTAVHFSFCFRLDEATDDDEDGWTLHFMVASKKDPSFKLALADYWTLNQRAKTQIVAQYGQDFEKNLLLALGSAARIYPKIWDGLDTDQPTMMRLTLDEAFAFLKEHAWLLEDAGYTIIVPSWWTPEGRRRAKILLHTSAHRSTAGSSAAPGSGYFGLEAVVRYRYELSIGGQPVSAAEWRALVQAKTALVRFRGEWMELDRDKMQQMLDFWQKRSQEQPELTLMDVIRLSTEAADDVECAHDDALADMMARLYDKSALQPVPDSPMLQGTLRDYQRRGVAWIHYLETLGLHGCLADDMGLGKTVEVIAHLVNEKDKHGQLPPTLLIAPTSVLGNWRKEIERFAPHLRTMVHHGSARIKQERAFGEASLAHDVVITSYPLARLDDKLLRSVSWHRVVVDEAQNIKNPQAAQTRAILKLPAHHRLALTGTPVENRLLDLWSILNFLNPGYLGKEAQFRKGFEIPIQKENDRARSDVLRRLVEPFILRRVKTDRQIIKDLPDKVEQKVYCNLTHEQASLYEAVTEDVAQQLDEAEGIQRRGLMLATLMKLKQICNHPAQFLRDGSAFSTERSHKLSRLSEMMEEVMTSGESMLIFTQFTEIGDALEKYLKQTLHTNTYYLHGSVDRRKREQMITEFQDPDTEPSVFVLSLRAGGVGITLTKANHVFHFDRWWNPAVEDQATDRAFRIGQEKNVFVHKFLALGTLEEKIDQMIEDKKKLAETIVGADESWLTELDNEAFKKLITLNKSAVLD